MALMERILPLRRHNWGFFDNLRSDLSRDMDAMNRNMDAEFERIRKDMFQLVPTDHSTVRDSYVTAPRQHPVVYQRSQGKPQLALRFNVQDFLPHEVETKIIGPKTVQVYAKHEEKSAHSTSFREYRRQYELPRGVDASKLQASLTSDGILSIEAPAEELQPAERTIAIEYRH